MNRQLRQKVAEPLRVLRIGELNALARLPSVLPFLGPDAYDLGWCYDAGGIALGRIGHPGAALILPQDDAAYEAHLLFTKGYAGKEALITCRLVRDFLFEKCNATLIFGLTPREYRAACLFSRRLGFKPVGLELDGANKLCVKHVMTRDTWEACLSLEKEPPKHL